MPAILSEEGHTRLIGPHDQGVSQADGDLYFNAPGTASVRWDGARATVLVEWEGWANSTEFAALLDAGVRALKDPGGSRFLAASPPPHVLIPAPHQPADRQS